MYFNIKDIEKIIVKMKCEFGDKFWDDFMRKEYALKTNECAKENLEKLETFLPIMESKLLLLKNFQKGNNYYNYPSRLCRTDIDSFWNSDKILNQCDNTILEQFKQYNIQDTLLHLSNKPCNDCQ